MFSLLIKMLIGGIKAKMTFHSNNVEEYRQQYPRKISVRGNNVTAPEATGQQNLACGCDSDTGEGAAGKLRRVACQF